MSQLGALPLRLDGGVDRRRITQCSTQRGGPFVELRPSGALVTERRSRRSTVGRPDLESILLANEATDASRTPLYQGHVAEDGVQRLERRRRLGEEVVLDLVHAGRDHLEHLVVRRQRLSQVHRHRRPSTVDAESGSRADFVPDDLQPA
jgi:hypothetical protein